jgi:FkbM family methyltransferase
MRLARAMDRPGLRWLAGALAGAALARRYNTPTAVTYRDRLWHCRRANHVEVRPDLEFGRPTWWDRVVNDIFFHDYVPRRGDLVLDLGAGNGEELSRISHAVGAEGRVLAFEPHPESFRALVATVRANGLANVDAFPQAVTDRAGVTTLNGDDASTRSVVTRTMTTLEVETTTIDDIFAQLRLDHVDFAKINIEGAELLALWGGAASLPRIRHLCISCHDFQADEGRAGDDVRTLDAVRDLLQSRGFTVTRMDDPRPWAGHYLYARSAETAL